MAGEELSPKVFGEEDPHRVNSDWRVPEMRTCLVCLRNSREATKTGTVTKGKMGDGAGCDQGLAIKTLLPRQKNYEAKQPR